MITTCSRLFNNGEQAVRTHLVDTSCEIFARLDSIEPHMVSQNSPISFSSDSEFIGLI